MDKLKLNQPETPNEVQGRDLFQTPNYAVDLLIPFINKWMIVWEPACGQGKIVYRLREKDYLVYGSDIVASLFTESVHNFLNKNTPFTDSGLFYDVIITNPPFSLKRKFYEKCLELDKPFALLIPADYSGWIIDAVDRKGCEKIIPTRRIDYITPTGLTGAGGHTSKFHSMWLTRGLNLGKTETFVELTNKDKENI